MDYEQANQYREAIEKAATELYRNDIRTRQLIDSCVGMGRADVGPIDPGRAERDAADIAIRACALLAARIFYEVGELKAARAERDHYKKAAEESLHLSPPRQFYVHGQIDGSVRS